ncbi:hypothetical protein ACQEVC_07360 [Plantactinospora sp. CA-294935]|uniref:hypothetical protein n=1 Tax=Plantactinospora sp. CA-294935 TaxID=3240012 RepID=UPI003D8CECA9
MRTLVTAPTDDRVWSDSSLSWLVRPGAEVIEERSGGSRIGASDVAAVRATCDLFAAGGDARGAQQALGQAVRLFEKRLPEDDPQWIRYFDDSELASELSHTFGDLRCGNDVIASARQYLASGGGSVRTTFFVIMKLAGGHLDLGEVEEACRTVRQALDLGSQLRSARCAEYVREFRSRATEFVGNAAYRDLAEGAVGHRLWGY